MKIKKILALVLAVVLLVGGTVLGTLAWLVSQTDPVVNTFTVGDVQITLDEALVNENGEPVDKLGEDGTVVDREDAPRVTENTYKLMPGSTYTKDPTVHVAEGSEPCIVFVKVENGLASVEADDEFEDGVVSDYVKIESQMRGEEIYGAEGTPGDNGWRLVPGTQNVYYNVLVKNGGEDAVVFSTFTISGDVTTTELAALNGAEDSAEDDAKIIVTAYAIQAENILDDLEAEITSDQAAYAWEQSGFGTSDGADATT